MGVDPLNVFVGPFFFRAGDGTFLRLDLAYVFDLFSVKYLLYLVFNSEISTATKSVLIHWHNFSILYFKRAQYH